MSDGPPDAFQWAETGAGYVGRRPDEQLLFKPGTPVPVRITMGSTMTGQNAKQQALDNIFTALRNGNMPEADIIALSKDLEVADVDWIMMYVEPLGGPQDFMDDLDEHNAVDNNRSSVIARGFFQFIDIVSVLIRGLGEPGISAARGYEDRDSHYIPWVIRYCSDDRFLKELRKSVPFLDL